MALRDDWLKLLVGYRVAPAAAGPVFDALAAAYSAPDRHYHNLEHLAEVFAVADRLAPDTDDPAAVQLAIWFHDAVYDPKAKDNEERSAELAGDLLGRMGVPASVIETVARLVRATAHLSSAEPPGDRDTATLLDADLAILGTDEIRYRRYAADVRKEYAWVPDDVYRKRRAAVLKLFLGRPRVFRHRLTFEQGEERARANMTAELRELDATTT